MPLLNSQHELDTRIYTIDTALFDITRYSRDSTYIHFEWVGNIPHINHAINNH